MKRIIAKSTLREFWEKHADSEQYLKTWYDTAKKAKWYSPANVKETYRHASILKNSRVVFNIKGNTYRLVVKFNYEKQWAFIPDTLDFSRFLSEKMANSFVENTRQNPRYACVFRLTIHHFLLLILSAKPKRSGYIRFIGTHSDYYTIDANTI